MRRFISLFFILSSSFAGVSFASCGSASCPIDVYTQEKTEKGMVRLDYSYEYIDQDQPQIGRHNASVGEIPGHHDEVATLNQTQRLSLDAGFSSRWSLQLMLPFVHREHEHIHHHMGTDELETWNFNGMGDLTLLNRFTVIKPENPSHPSIAAIAGGILPTGRDHITNADGEEAEVGVLPGKGAYSLILGASSVQSFTARTLSGAYAQMPFFISSTYQWNGQGPDNYKMGNLWLVNMGVTYPILPKIGLMNQLNLKINRHDDAGDTNEEIEKTGGSYLYYTPGLQFTMAENLWSYIYVQLPVYQRVNEIQLTSNANFIAGLSYKFSAL